jgi:DNA-binding transcriptional LysR family regulator
MDRFAAMLSFIRVVEKGSFAAAARGSGFTAPMVGNHVRFLEERLGTQLINRTTRQHSLTELGRVYYEQCRQIMTEVDAAEGIATDNQAAPRGLLRVTAPVTLGTTILPGLLAEYLHYHREVRIDLALHDRRVDLLDEGFDVAIRSGDLPDSGLIVRSLAPLSLVVCATPGYLSAHGIPRTPADLAEHDCLDFAHSSTPGEWHFAGPAGNCSKKVKGPFRANNGQSLRMAALADLGIIMQPEMLVTEDLSAGSLVRLLPGYTPLARTLQILTLPDRYPTPKLRSFVAFIVSRFNFKKGGI